MQRQQSVKIAENISKHLHIFPPIINTTAYECYINMQIHNTFISSNSLISLTSGYTGVSSRLAKR